MLSGHLLAQLIKFASNLIMTRLLAPEAFGLMAITIVLMVGISLLTDLGLVQNVVKSNKTDDPSFMDTIWTIQVIKGLSIWGLTVLFSIALYFAISFHLIPTSTVYSNPLLPILLPILTLTVVIQGLEPTWVMLATKKMDLSLITKIELFSQVASTVSMIIWAYFDKSIWAIIVGCLVGSIARCVMCYLFQKDAPNRWLLKPEHVKDIIHFGKWILLNTMVGFFISNGDRVMLGGLISEAELGVYMIAMLFFNLITALHGKFSSGVMYAAVSEAKNHSMEKMSSVYYKLRMVSDSGLLAISGLFFASGSILIGLLYDERYALAGITLEIISISLIAFRFNLTDLCLTALDKNHFITMQMIFRGVVLVVAVPYLYHLYGYVGGVWGVVVSYVCNIPVSLYYKYKLKLLDVKKELVVLPVFFVGYLAGKLFNVTVSYLKTF